MDEKDGYIERTPIGYFDEDFKYLSLSYQGTTWMCITPNEINTMQPHINQAKGNVLVFGLGLGYYPFMVSLKSEVKDIYVIELDQNIIDIFKENLLPLFPNKEKIHIIKGDAKEYIKNIDNSFNTIFIDLSHNPEDGLPLYLRFNKLLKDYKCEVRYWLEKSIIAMYRRCLLTLFEENLMGFTKKNYLKAENEYDKIINDLYFKTESMEFNSFSEIKSILQDNSIRKLVK